MQDYTYNIPRDRSFPFYATEILRKRRMTLTLCVILAIKHWLRKTETLAVDPQVETCMKTSTFAAEFHQRVSLRHVGSLNLSTVTTLWAAVFKKVVVLILNNPS